VTLFTVCTDWLAGRRARASAYYVRQFVKQFVQLSHSVNAVLQCSRTACSLIAVVTDVYLTQMHPKFDPNGG